VDIDDLLGAPSPQGGRLSQLKEKENEPGQVAVAWGSPN